MLEEIVTSDPLCRENIICAISDNFTMGETGGHWKISLSEREKASSKVLVLYAFIWLYWVKVAI